MKRWRGWACTLCRLSFSTKQDRKRCSERLLRLGVGFEEPGYRAAFCAYITNRKTGTGNAIGDRTKSNCLNKMKATIYSHKTIIGTADLQVGDESMGCIFGQFIPNDNYFKNIQRFVWEFWKIGEPNNVKWDSLRFNAQLDNGFFILSCGGYTFDDSPDFPDEPKRIDIAGINIDVLNFKSDMLLEPWNTIRIEQKISFEDELIKEITPEKSLLNFFKVKDHHRLIGSEFSAFAKYGPNDDVLFEVNKEGDESRFAVVHLTWISRKAELSNYFPATHFFPDFDDFAEKRMKPDNKEWKA